MRSLLLALVVFVAAPLAAQQARQQVPMDSARARQLYVSNRPEDHPVANYAEDITDKARTDSIFAARSRGVMRYEKITYRSEVDGMEIPAYVFSPLTTRPKGHAAIVWVHGGVHGNWDQNYLPFIIEAVQRGYVILAPEYRGSTGYGEAHHRAIDYGGKELDDVESAHAVLQARPEVDPARIGIMAGAMADSSRAICSSAARARASSPVYPWCPRRT